MSDITRTRLETLLNALGEQVAARASFAHVVVVGGSGLLAIGVGQRPTEDVDIVAIDDDGALVSAAPLPGPLADAAGIVARDFEELRAAAAWARTHNAPGPFDDALAETLLAFGVEDDGRRA